MNEVALACGAVALCLSGAAAVFDRRTRRIPDALTLPALAGAPLVLGFVGGLPAATGAVLGAVAGAFVPLLLARRAAMGGGDVKLLAAIGALLGVTLGVEAQLFAFLALAAHVVTRRALAGELRALGRGTADAFKRSFRRGDAGRADPERMQSAALAPYVALGVFVALALELAL